MNRISVVLLLLWVSAACHAQKTSFPEGAWLEGGVKWSNAPPQVHSNLQFAQAAIIYFGSDHSFGVIYATVNRVTNRYEVISSGDGQVVYLGTWESRKGGNCCEVQTSQPHCAKARRVAARFLEGGCH